MFGIASLDCMQGKYNDKSGLNCTGTEADAAKDLALSDNLDLSFNSLKVPNEVTQTSEILKPRGFKLSKNLTINSSI